MSTRTRMVVVALGIAWVAALVALVPARWQTYRITREYSWRLDGPVFWVQESCGPLGISWCTIGGELSFDEARRKLEARRASPREEVVQSY